MLLGIVVGMVLGLIPGLGGVIGMALLMPLAIGHPPEVAFAFLLGIYAVSTQTDTIPAVLIGVPGTAAAAATTVDGHPLARKGEAGRALSAAYIANIFGTLVAAAIFVVFLPLLRAIINLFAAPEFFMLSMLGLVMAGTLSGRSALRGLMMAGVGLIIAMVGLHPNTGEPRFAFGFGYLWDGVPFVPLILGIFAVPEVIDLAVKRSTIASSERTANKGVVAGFGDTIREYRLVIRCGVIGTVCGMIPGLGGTVAEWFAYGHAVQSAKDSSTFGQGDIRGVIAPETATAAQKPGAIIPTVAFGIPGNAGMAILLSVFFIVGLAPGPDMVTTKLHITFVMIWTTVVANIIAALLALGLQRYLVLVCYVRPEYLVPLILAFMTIGASITTRDFGDVLVFGIFGLLGYYFKRAGWPRIPLILGVILGKLAEPYLFISFDRYGAAFLWERPIVGIIFVLMIVTVTIPIWRRRRGTGQSNAADEVM